MLLTSRPSKLLSAGLEKELQLMLSLSYTFPSPTIYIELLTKDSVAFQEDERREVVVERDSPLGNLAF